jgi:hypothetical protein
MNVLTNIGTDTILGLSLMAVFVISVLYYAWYHLIKYPNGKPKKQKGIN